MTSLLYSANRVQLLGPESTTKNQVESKIKQVSPLVAGYEPRSP